MKESDKFRQMYEEASKAFEVGSTGTVSKLDMIEDARKVYNNIYGDILADKYKTRSMFVSCEGMIVPDLFAEAVIARIPSFAYKTNKDYAVKAKENINQILKDAIGVHRLDSKILPIAIAGFRDGVGVFEVYPKELRKSGYMVKTNEEGDQELEEYDKFLGYGLEIKQYDVLLDEVLIDPLADSNDIAGTARYVIVKWGDFSKEQIENLAKMNEGKRGWDIKVDELMLTDGLSYRVNDAVQDLGMKKPSHISIHKVFYSDGTIDFVANKRYLIGKNIMNSKMIKEMPLIFFTPIPGGGTPYGRSVWDLIRHAVDIKSGCVNLSADNTAKNITASIVTDSTQLSEETSAYSLASNRIVHIEPGERPVRDRLTQIQWVDMTVGLKFLYEVASNDLQRITKISDLSLGSPGFSPRTDGVVEAMNNGIVSNTAMFLKQTEDTLFQPLAKHILDIFYNFFDNFDLGVERELLNVTNIRVQKGTSLEGAQGTQIQLLQSALQFAMQMPMDWNVVEVLKAYFKESGLPEIELFLATPEESMMKILMSMQVPEQIAQSMAGQISEVAQKYSGQGGQQQ